MRLKNLLRESLLLHENVKQAEKILRTNNIPLDDENYLDLRSKLESVGSLGYLGLITKLLVAEDGRIDYLKAVMLIGLLQQHKNHLHLLPQNINSYESYTQLYDDFKHLPKFVFCNWLSKKLTNRRIQRDLSDWGMVKILSDQLVLVAKKFFKGAPPAYRKEVLRASDKYRTTQEFLMEIAKTYEKSVKFSKFENTLSKVKELSGAKIVYQNEGAGIILIEALNHEAACELGPSTWCIVTYKGDFEKTKGDGRQFVGLNFNEEPKYRVVGFTINTDKEISDCYDRYNEKIVEPREFLINLGYPIEELSKESRINNAYHMFMSWMGKVDFKKDSTDEVESVTYINENGETIGVLEFDFGSHETTFYANESIFNKLSNKSDLSHSGVWEVLHLFLIDITGEEYGFAYDTDFLKYRN